MKLPKIKSLFLFFVLIMLSSCWDTDTFTYGYDGLPHGPMRLDSDRTANYIYTGTGLTEYGPSSLKPINKGTYTVNVSGLDQNGIAFNESHVFEIVSNLSLNLPIAILTTCIGNSSTPASLGVTGLGLTASVTITAPENFEISTNSVDNYSSSLTLTNTNTVSQTLYIRLNSTAADGIYSGTITASSTGVTDALTTISRTVLSKPSLSTNAISLCLDATYLITKTSAIPALGNGWTVSGTITVNDGYVTAGATPGNYTVSYTDGCAQTVTATVTVTSTSTLAAITDGLASYKFNNNPQGPLGSGNVIYMGYNGFNYSSTIRPTNTGFYRANNVSGSSAGSPFEFDIFRCTTCGTVSSFGTRPQGTLSGNTSGTGQLTYTSSNGGGPFTIVYQATGASPVTVNNISSTVAFNVVTPTITTSYKLISVTDESTKASTDFTGTTASITVTHSIGESFGGGIVFYVDENNHGLIAATSDQSNGIAWGPYSTTEATATAMGTGLANTTKIISSQGETATNYAAGLASTYNGGGNNVWYLPSKDELNLMYTNIGKGASSPNYNIGGFRDEYYWSSSESGYVNAWGQNFLSGFQSTPLKSVTIYVRAIRAF